VAASPDAGDIDEPVGAVPDVPGPPVPVACDIDGIARVAAEAADDAPSDFTIRPAWTAVMPARPQPPTTPDATAACSTEGSSR
jgi:hypothetical protein